jgi:lysophospholipase L1-like esterase
MASEADYKEVFFSYIGRLCGLDPSKSELLLHLIYELPVYPTLCIGGQGLKDAKSYNALWRATACPIGLVYPQGIAETTRKPTSTHQLRSFYLQFCSEKFRSSRLNYANSVVSPDHIPTSYLYIHRLSIFRCRATMFGTSQDLIFLFGDSITQEGYDQTRGFGWVSQLSHDYVRKLSVVNAGLSGYGTDKALAKLPLVIPPPGPNGGRIKILAVFFGANDARLPNTMQARQHVPLPEYKDNLRKILSHEVVRAHDAHIVLMTPPPIDERMCIADDAAKGINQIRRSAKATAEYAQAVRDIGSELEVAVCDLWGAFMQQAGWRDGDALLGLKGVDQKEDGLQSMLRDGLHLTDKGNKIVYAEFLKIVGENWPDLAPEKMGFVLPYWADEEAWKDLEKETA